MAVITAAKNSINKREHLMETIIKQDEYAKRRQRLMQAMGEDSIAIIPAAAEVSRTGDSVYQYRQNNDFYYVTGFNEPEAVAVLIPNKNGGEFILFCRDRNKEMEIWTGKRAGQEGTVENFHADIAHSFSELNHKMPEILQGKQQVYVAFGRDHEFDERVTKWINDLRMKVRGGVEAPSEIINIEHLLHDMRLIKSPAEIIVMREAAAISVEAHRRAIALCEPGMYEYELEAELQHEFLRQGSRHPAYESIVASGGNACVLHYVDNNKQMQDGDLVLIDAGCEYQLYASDVTRTFPVNGKFNKEQRAIYELVLAAQLAGLKIIKPGVPWPKIQEVIVKVITEGLVELGILKGDVEKLIEDKKYRDFYMHNSGHWLGMDTHDVGDYKQKGEWRLLEAGMMLTVEPGIYIAEDSKDVDEKWRGIGVRIEDDLLVTEKGHENLSLDLPKSVEEIEALMA